MYHICDIIFSKAPLFLTQARITTILQISNFEYLMQLNTLAGRSYNDITQVIFLDNYPSMSNNSMHWLNFFDRFCFPFSVSCFPMDSL